MAAAEPKDQSALITIAVGINGPNGSSSLLVFDSVHGSFKNDPVAYQLPGEITAIAIGQLDEDTNADVVVASAGEVVLVHGRSRPSEGQDADPGAREGAGKVEHLNVPARILSVAVGDFVWDEAHRSEVAVLSDEGQVHLLVRSEPVWKEFTTIRVARRKAISAALRAVTPQSLLRAAHISNQPTEDLLVLDPRDKHIHIITDNAALRRKGSSPESVQLAASLDVEKAPLAMLAMPLAPSSEPGLVIMRDGAAAPTILSPATEKLVVPQAGPTTTCSDPMATITIPASGTGVNTGAPAIPYPSPINISGMAGLITDVNVTLNGISHTATNDIDILLVSPTGKKFIVMSDIGQLSGTYTLELIGGRQPPGPGGEPAGTYKPSDRNTNPPDAFPSPAPAGPYNVPFAGGTATFASAFNGDSPNGVWNLYVVDDTAGDIGSISSWCITITTASAAATTTAVTSSVNRRSPQRRPTRPL